MKKQVAATLVFICILAFYVFVNSSQDKNDEEALEIARDLDAFDDTKSTDEETQREERISGFSLRAIIDAIIQRDLASPSMAELAAKRSPDTFKKIAHQIEVLRQESLQDSLNRSADVGFYYYPGNFSIKSGNILTTRLRPDAGLRDAKLILSNRRILKLLDELANIPREQASAMLSDHVRELLTRYSKLYADELAEQSHLMDPSYAPEIGHGPVIQISDNPDGSPTLEGTRLSILSLVLVAGQLGLEDTLDAIYDVVDIAYEQREYWYGIGENTQSPFGSATLERLGLYNPLILGSTLKHLHPDQFASNEWPVESIELTSFDALRSKYDLSSLGIPVDYSQGSTSVDIIVSLPDSEMDQILEMLGWQLEYIAP